MSIISGTNITLLASQTITIQSNFVVRTISGLSSNDTFDTAENFVTNYIGDLDPVNNGDSFTLTIYNSDLLASITMNPGTDMTFNPINVLLTSTIPPDSARTYLFVQTAAVLGVSCTLAVYPY